MLSPLTQREAVPALKIERTQATVDEPLGSRYLATLHRLEPGPGHAGRHLLQGPELCVRPGRNDERPAIPFQGPRGVLTPVGR